MDVIILAGGLGSRLRSVVNDVPKCMAPVCEKPFLFYLLHYLSKYETIDKVILSVGYLREIIFDWLNNKNLSFPFHIDYVIENEPLGTGGAIRLAISKATSGEVCIINGDTFFDLDLELFHKEHIESRATVSIALKSMNNFDRYGNVTIRNDNSIIRFSEKTKCIKGQINGGVYFINKENNLMDNLPEKFSFETDVLQKNVPLQNLYGFIHNDYFIDIGVPEDYKRANDDFKILFK